MKHYIQHFHKKLLLHQKHEYNTLQSYQPYYNNKINILDYYHNFSQITRDKLYKNDHSICLNKNIHFSTKYTSTKTIMKQKIAKLHLSNISSAQKSYNHTITSKTSDTVQYIQQWSENTLFLQISLNRKILTHISWKPFHQT